MVKIFQNRKFLLIWSLAKASAWLVKKFWLENFSQWTKYFWHFWLRNFLASTRLSQLSQYFWQWLGCQPQIPLSTTAAFSSLHCPPSPWYTGANINHFLKRNLWPSGLLAWFSCFPKEISTNFMLCLIITSLPGLFLIHTLVIAISVLPTLSSSLSSSWFFAYYSTEALLKQYSWASLEEDHPTTMCCYFLWIIICWSQDVLIIFSC